MVTLNGVRHESPTRWSEMKTRHYQRLIKEWDQDKDIADRDYFKLFNILTDSKFGAFENTIENQVKIEHAFAWVVFEPFRFKDSPPQTLEISGRVADIPKSLKTVSIGANIKARQALDKASVLVDEKGNFKDCDCYSLLVAIYLQPDLLPTIKGGFNWANAQLLEKGIAEMPIEVVRPIGFFLLKNVYKYGQRHERTWKQILINLANKIRRMLPDLRRFKGLSLTQTFH